MNEQANQNTSSNEQVIEDDPLAELARIVAGGPEITDQAPDTQPEVQDVKEASAPVETVSAPEVASEPSQVSEAAEVDVALDAALENQLEQELSSFDLETPDFVDDINASVEEIKASEEAPTEEAPVEIEASQPQEAVDMPAAEVATGEDAFQDDLISALEDELGPEEPVEAIAEEVAAPVAEVEQPEIEASMEEAMAEAFAEPAVEAASVVEPEAAPVAAEEELSLEDALMAEMSETVETAEETPAVEPVGEVPIEEPQIEQPVEASLEDDLGAAFASEFEQLNAQVEEAPAPEMVADVQPVAELPVAEVAMEANSAGDPDLEIDFEAAFAEELQSTAPAQASMGEVEMPAENVVAFEGLEQTQVGDLETDFDMTDPGHVGSVDEIAAVSANETETASKGGGMKYAAAALIIALFAGTIATGYGFLGGGENATVASLAPEVIKADDNPVKIKPEDPGGFVPENQDNASYTDLGGENNIEVSQKELVSTTEEPASINTQVAGVQPKSDDRLTPSEDTGATPNAAAPSVSPKVVQTVVVKPDGTIINNPAPAPKPVETASNTVTIGQPPIIEAETVETLPVPKAEGIEGAVTTGAVKVPTASPLPKPKPAPKPVQQAAVAKPKPAAPAPAARKSEWVVQVSSQRSAEAAQSSFNSMRNRFAALRGRAVSIQRANVNGATYYRVRVQTESRADANRLCSNLASAGGSCFVTR